MLDEKNLDFGLRIVDGETLYSNICFYNNDSFKKY